MILLLAPFPAFAQDAGWIGVTVADQKDRGVLIRTIDANGPAAKAGLKENDIIVEFNRQDVAGVLQLTRLVRETPVGRTVEVKVRRDNRDQTFQVTTEAPPRYFGNRIRVLSPDARIQTVYDTLIRTTFSQAGIRVDQMTAQLRTFFGVTGSDGVLVTSVEPGSEAEKAGVKAGDVITSVDGEGISSTSEFSREMRNAGNSITLKIVRDKQEREIRIEIPATR